MSFVRLERLHVYQVLGLRDPAEEWMLQLCSGIFVLVTALGNTR
jgi:hypothetical protein